MSEEQQELEEGTVALTAIGLAFNLGRMAKTTGVSLPVVRAALIDGWEFEEAPSAPEIADNAGRGRSLGGPDARS